MNEDFLLRICKLITSVIFAICLAFTLSYTFFAQVLVQGFSMAPHINDRNVVLVNRLYKNLLPLKKYDVIAFSINGQTSIKKIYGLPGETVVISDGSLYINDIEIDNENLKNSLSLNMEQNVKLGRDEYYVLGDNLDSSKDSRFSDIGNVKRNNIIGKVWYIIR